MKKVKHYPGSFNFQVAEDICSNSKQLRQFIMPENIVQLHLVHLKFIIHWSLTMNKIVEHCFSVLFIGLDGMYLIMLQKG